MTTRRTLLAGIAGAALPFVVPVAARAGAQPPAGATRPAPASPAARGGESGASTPVGDLLLTDALVVTMDDARRVHEPGFVWIRDGAIHRVGPMSGLGEVPEGIARRRLGAGRLVMPGLVNCHTHLSNGILRGLYDEMPLDVWFSRGMWPVLEALGPEEGAIGARLALCELMTTGVTTVVGGDFGMPNRELLDGVLESVAQARVRGIVSRITVDNPDESGASQSIPARYRERPAFAADEVLRLRRRHGSARVSVVPEALGVLRCTPEMITAMHELSVRERCEYLMHVASSPDERDESRRKFGHGSVAELDRLGVLAPRTILAHAIWLDDAEIAMLAARGTGISHNPVSNAYYASGIARLAELLKAGVRVGLGTDGATTNNGQNLWETMKMALLFQKERLQQASFGSAELALELATRGGAAAVHASDRIGSLAPGRRADLIVVDTERVSLAPRQTLVSNLVYSNDPHAVRDVYVDGELVVEDGVHRYVDRERTIAQAREAFGRVLQRTKLDRYLEQRTRWTWPDAVPSR
jgi:5-methylthioadenosine/S-adenosylhomocysteine deaminase